MRIKKIDKNLDIYTFSINNLGSLYYWGMFSNKYFSNKSIYLDESIYLDKLIKKKYFGLFNIRKNIIGKFKTFFVFIIALIILCALSKVSFSQSIPVPYGIDGRVYNLEEEPISANLSFNSSNGLFISGSTSDNILGRYSVGLNGNYDDDIIIKAWNGFHESLMVLKLKGSMHDVNIYLNDTPNDCLVLWLDNFPLKKNVVIWNAKQNIVWLDSDGNGYYNKYNFVSIKNINVNNDNNLDAILESKEGFKIFLTNFVNFSNFYSPNLNNNSFYNQSVAREILVRFEENKTIALRRYNRYYSYRISNYEEKIFSQIEFSNEIKKGDCRVENRDSYSKNGSKNVSSQVYPLQLITSSFVEEEIALSGIIIGADNEGIEEIDYQIINLKTNEVVYGKTGTGPFKGRFSAMISRNKNDLLNLEVVEEDKNYITEIKDSNKLTFILDNDNGYLKQKLVDNAQESKGNDSLLSGLTINRINEINDKEEKFNTFDYVVIVLILFILAIIIISIIKVKNEGQ